MTWPLVIALGATQHVLAGPGRHALARRLDEAELDEVLRQARAHLGAPAVGWLPASGGLVSNLAVWENILLATEWLAPASLAAQEARLRRWLDALAIAPGDAAGLLAARPARVSPEERRLAGWLRQLLLRPKLLLLEAPVLPPAGSVLWNLVESELGGCALLLIDGERPGWQPLPQGPGGNHDAVA